MAVSKRIRTDLALETTERFKEENTEIRGVEIQEEYDEEKDCLLYTSSPELWQCAGYYVLLFLGVEILGMSRETVTWNGATGKRAENHAFMQEKKNHGEGKGWLRKYQLLSGISGIMLILGLGILIYHPSGNLQITCLDIGQGDCISIQLPQGQTFLIDGGSSNKKNIARYQILPFLKNRGIGVIDAILISHTDNDHISGVLEMCIRDSR